MLKEFIEALAKQAVAAAGPQLKETDPHKNFAVLDADGTVKFCSGKPTYRQHESKDLETIVAFTERFPNSAIWYSRDYVYCLINDEERRDTVRLEMIESDQISKLRELGDNKPLMTQRDFLFMLRTVFTASAFPTCPRLIDILRQVKFETGTKAEGVVQRGKSSVGKEISAAATFLEAVPEQVTVNVPLFENDFAIKSYDVICALEIYEAEQRLQLFPLPGEIEKAYARAESDLYGEISALLGKETKTPVYYGSP